MARSVRELIEFLLGEISLCGAQGASPTQVLAFIDDFYGSRQSDNTTHLGGGVGRVPTIDHRFRQNVWMWLTRNPEVSVGKNREGNNLTLDQVQVQNAGSTANEHIPSADPRDNVESGSVSKFDNGLRVFVSEERMWLAIAGHEPDISRVLPLEFALLSIIASRKSQGIFQPDLAILSGQDKRSIPKRTDSLSQKGYIEKRAIQHKSARTSLCTLRKFIRSKPVEDGGFEPRVEGGVPGEPAAVIDFPMLVDKLFQCLKEYNVITRIDLKAKLGMEDRWRGKVLGRAIRKLERIGCVRRVRAVSQYSDVMKSRHPSIMLIREPTETDLRLFHEDSRSLMSYLEQEDADMMEVDQEQSQQDGGEEFPVIKRDIANEPEVEYLEQVGRIVPQWTPDRPLSNMIFDIIDKAGREGMTNRGITVACTGQFFQRPLESFISRLVETWQISQPVHLRHLSLVRDVGLRGTAKIYIHYSLRNFASLVDDGYASWEAVEFVPSGKSAIKPPPVDAKPRLDEYGFSLDETPSNLLNGGDATLRSCLETAKPHNYVITTFDPVALKTKKGNYVVRFRGRLISGQTERLARYRESLEEGSLTPESTLATRERKRRGSEAGLGESPDLVEMLDAEEIRPTKRQKKVKEFVDPYAGMSEKEKLEAQGFDESWTEYSVLVMERPGPGIFITPYGKRRPVGKARGRPGKSRIAVIKSDKLKDFGWFVQEEATTVRQTEEENGTGTGFTAVNMAPISSRPPSPVRMDVGPSETPASPAGRAGSSSLPKDTNVREMPVIDATGDHAGKLAPPKKRKYNEPDAEEREDILLAESPPRPKRKGGPGRPPKKKRAPPTKKSTTRGETEEAEPGSTTTPTTPVQPSDGGPPVVAPSVGKRGRKPRQVETPSMFVQGRQSAKKQKTSESTVDSGQLNERREMEIQSLEEGQPSQTHQDDDKERSPQALEQPATAPTQSVLPDSVTHPSTAEAHDENRDEHPEIGDTAAGAQSVEVAMEGAGGDTIPARQTEIERVTETPAVLGPITEAAPSLNTTDVSSRLESEAAAERTTLSQPHEIGSSTPELTADLKDKPRPKKADLRGGSIAMLRRKIIMDVIDSCGGIYPLGSELWYPFTTAWLKTRQTERPDYRTIRSAAKTLVEGGKLRQFTFSGRNKKGLIVTKSLLAKPEISATDPLVLEMQRRMLEADPQLYFPPGPEIDLSLKKSHATLSRVPAKLPQMEGEVMVTLHQVPARMKPPELRTPSVNKYDSGGMTKRPQGRVVQRLESTRRRPKSHSLLNALTVPRGTAVGPSHEFKETSTPLVSDFRVSRRGILPISRRQQYTGFLCPPQPFHHPTGTFGTGFGKPSWTMKRPPARVSTGLPGSLDDILSMTDEWPLSISNIADPVSTKVISEIDAVGRWETRNQELFDTKKEGWTYINHGIPGPFESAPLQGSVQFDQNEPIRRQRERTAPPLYQERRKLAPFRIESAPLGQPSRRTGGTRARKPADVPVNRRLSQFQEPKTEKTTKGPASGARRNKLVKFLSDDMVQKLTIAIVVVRTLAGGLEGKMVDWHLVTLAFPDYDSKFIRDRGKAILSKNRLQMSKMQSDFQDRFAEAYERDQVPPIDYGDLTRYDWQSVVEWAKSQLEMPRSDNLPSLPANREQFNSLFDVRLDPMQSIDEMYQHSTQVTIPRKQALLAGAHFSIPVCEDGIKQERQSPYAERLKIAKTWVRANVITPEESYDPTTARKMLEYLGEELVGRAIQSLITERVISMGNRGRVTPGRNYDVTEYFVHAFGRKRAIEATQLKRAVTFKTTILDTQLHLEGKCDVNYDAEDGDILVLINLFAEGRITMWPRNPPKDKYGLTDGGYLTRMMDKGKLRFDVEIRPVPGRYIYGNPVHLPNSIPRGDLPLDFPPSEGIPPLYKIPLWFDIHGKFVKMLWDLVVAGVVGYVAARPGLKTRDISQIFRPHIDEWEVGLVLEWMEEAGVVERLGGLDGWGVKEWWWLVVQDLKGSM
ncbi:hypothetical protein FQN51_008769 [Onygenales sp. PD_10]|nr:hypothetical protein FQN51_008769 [Onygenales sp. PD_10]